MFIAVFVGVLSGVVGTGCWFLMQLVLNIPGVLVQLGANWFAVPIAIGAVAAGLHTAARAFQTRGVSDRSVRPAQLARRQSLTDVFESYHFGIFILHPFNWLARGAVSMLTAFLIGTFGVEGGVLELCFAALPLLSRYARLFIEEKQTFVICTIAGSLSLSLGAPFSGGLIALELVRAVEAKVRGGAVIAALTSYGTVLLFQNTMISGIFAESSVERLNVFRILFGGLKPLNLEFIQWMIMSTAAVGIGIAAGLLALVTSRGLVHGGELFANIFHRKFQWGMLVAGVLMGITILLVPDAFFTPWRALEEVAWLHMSSLKAAMVLTSSWVLLVLAFSGWGSSGLFSPVLFLGALLGYAFGNAIGSVWALPLAIAGSAAMLAAMFRVPIAAAALVLEVGHDGPIWWLATVAVISTSIFCRLAGVKAVHEILLERAGLRLLGGRAASVLATLKTREAMTEKITSITERAGIQEMRVAASASRHNFVGVVSETDGTYIGLLSLEQLPGRIRHVLRPDARPGDVMAVERVVEIRDLIDTYIPVARPDDTLEHALGLLQDSPCLAVVDAERKLCGLVFESAIAGVYKREIAATVIRQS